MKPLTLELLPRHSRSSSRELGQRALARDRPTISNRPSAAPRSGFGRCDDRVGDRRRKLFAQILTQIADRPTPA